MALSSHFPLPKTLHYSKQFAIFRKFALCGDRFRKRGSASYIVREVRSVRERERERDTDRERERERERERQTEMTSP